MSERLPSKIEADLLIRRVQGDGGFAMVLKRGDADRGVIILVITQKGDHFAYVERGITSTGEYRWQTVGPKPESDSKTLAEWSQRRLRYDPDLWLIELDVPDPERFIAELTDIG